MVDILGTLPVTRLPASGSALRQLFRMQVVRPPEDFARDLRHVGGVRRIALERQRVPATTSREHRLREAGDLRHLDVSRFAQRPDEARLHQLPRGRNRSGGAGGPVRIARTVLAHELERLQRVRERHAGRQAVRERRSLDEPARHVLRRLRQEIVRRIVTLPRVA